MNDVIDTIKYKNHTIEVGYDEYYENPIEEWDMLGTFKCFHNNYNLSNTKDFDEMEDVKKHLKNCIWFPLYLYDHSGITISTTPFSCVWDSGQIGWIFVTREKIKKEHNVKRISKNLTELVERILINEVKLFDDYLTGNVYRCQIINEDGEHIASMGSSFGDIGKDDITTEAKSTIDYEIKEIKENKQKEMEDIYNQDSELINYSGYDCLEIGSILVG